MRIQADAEIQRDREKAQADTNLLATRANTQLQLEMQAEGERQRLTMARQISEVSHLKALGEVQVSTQRTIRQEALEDDEARNSMQIEYMDKRIRKENEGVRARLMMEGSARRENEELQMRQHEREIARIVTQKKLVDSSTALASSLQNGGMSQRQIGYITGEV